MEPTIVKKDGNRIVLIIILILIIIVAVLAFMRNKTEAPANEQLQTITQSESQQLDKDISNATTFDNESDLSSIDKEF